MKKCKYCAQAINDDKTFCNAECEHELNKYNTYMKKFLPLMIILVVLCLVAIIIQFLFFKDLSIISKLALLVLGITLFAFPFGNAADFLGIKKQKILIRCLACVMIVIAIISIITNFRWPN